MYPRVQVNIQMVISMRAGVVRAEGLVVTTVAAADKILIQQQQTNGQYLPREVAYSNFITGGGTGLTANSVVLTNASGDLTTDAAITYASSILTVTTTHAGSSGTAGTITIFPATAANGTFVLSGTNNTNNFASTLTNSAVGQATVYTLPDPGASTANIILSAGNQTIAGNKTLTGTTQINTLNLGASGTAGTLTIFPATAANGTFVLSAVNNTNNFAATLRNVAVGQATVYSLPDPGTATTNIVLDQGAQTIAGVKTFSSIPIGTAQAVQVYLSPITAQAGAVSVIFQAPYAGTVTSVAVAVSGAFTATDIVVTPSVYHAGSPTTITGGAVTVATAGSGVASHATVTPSAANTFVSGDTITATVTGGVGTVNGVITLYVTRTA